MPVDADHLTELAAQLHTASLEQAAHRRPDWSALSLKAAAALEAIVEPNRPGRSLRGTSPWARFRRWLWWILGRPR
jgi:hypothetical protein